MTKYYFLGCRIKSCISPILARQCGSIARAIHGTIVFLPQISVLHLILEYVFHTAQSPEIGHLGKRLEAIPMYLPTPVAYNPCFLSDSTYYR